MKIVNFYEFCDLPDGIIYANYDFYNKKNRSGLCSGLWKRGSVIRDDDKAIDFFFCSLNPEFLNDNDPDSLQISDNLERWGEFDYLQMFVVYDELDIENLKKLLGN